MPIKRWFEERDKILYVFGFFEKFPWNRNLNYKLLKDINLAQKNIAVVADLFDRDLRRYIFMHQLNDEWK